MGSLALTIYRQVVMYISSSGNPRGRLGAWLMPGICYLPKCKGMTGREGILILGQFFRFLLRIGFLVQLIETLSAIMVLDNSVPCVCGKENVA